MDLIFTVCISGKEEPAETEVRLEGKTRCHDTCIA